MKSQKRNLKVPAALPESAFRPHKNGCSNRRAEHFWRALLAWGVVLVLILLLFEATDLDLRVQDRLFDAAAGRWMVDRHAPIPRFLFYTGIKGLIIVFGVGLLTCYGLSFLRPSGDATILASHRQGLLTVVLALALVPAVIGGLKEITNVYCPSQLTRYGGDKPYAKLFESMPATCSHCGSGHCFPAGHASGGFALMALWHLARTRHRKAAGLAVGMGLGWMMGLYQMLKGAHFLSHTVVTMIGAWMLIRCAQTISLWLHPPPTDRTDKADEKPVSGTEGNHKDKNRTVLKKRSVVMK